MRTAIPAPARARGRAPAAPTSEPDAFRAGLIGVTVVLLIVLLLLPLVVVLVEALSRGVGAVLQALSDPESLAAIRLTLIVAAISVPLNTVCGVAGSWCITRFSFYGRGLLMTIIELPLSVSPVVSGLVWVLLFGANGWLGPTLERHGLRVSA